MSRAQVRRACLSASQIRGKSHAQNLAFLSQVRVFDHVSTSTAVTDFSKLSTSLDVCFRAGKSCHNLQHLQHCSLKQLKAANRHIIQI